jgi:hypothetical protein
MASAVGTPVMRESLAEIWLRRAGALEGYAMVGAAVSS